MILPSVKQLQLAPPASIAPAMDSTPASNPTRRQVVCDCSKCILKSFRNEHEELQPGRLVSNTTRSNHRKKDREKEAVSTLNVYLFSLG
jgi:hypothetical protein